MIKKTLGLLASILALSFLMSCGSSDINSVFTSSEEDNLQTVSENVSSYIENSENLSDQTSSTADTIVSTDNTISTDNTPHKPESVVTYQRQELKKGYVYDTAKILCFGDSFTAGSGTDGGYRYYLFEKLYKVGAVFEFVGQYQHSYYNLPTKYTYHLAVGGKKTDDAISMYTGYVERFGNDYDIILCMFGINDAYTGRTTDEIFGYYTELLNTIYQDKEDAIIYIASIPAINGCFNDFNQEVEEFCLTYAAENEKEVYFVNMNGDYPLSRVYDCLSAEDEHPNNSGNEKMASSWYDAIVNRVLEINDNVIKDSDKTVSVEGVTLNCTEASIAINERLSLNFEVVPAEADVKTVLWSSSDQNILVVDNYGIVTPKSLGTATVTATTLDGDFVSECQITVTDRKELPTDLYTKEIFDSKFSTTEMWEGDIDMIRTDLGYAMTAWVGDSKTITTSKEIDFGSNFMLAMSYNVSGGEEAINDTKYSSVTFGDFKLVVSRCAGKVELFHKEESLGSYTYHSINNRFEDYFVVYNKGEITVIRGGETLFTAKVTSESVKSVLSYTWNTSWNKATCKYIKVYGHK